LTTGETARRVRSESPQQYTVGAEKAAPRVTSHIVHPGARVIWCLRRRQSDVRCLIFPAAVPVEIQVLQDRDVVLTEFFPEEWLAMNWAHAYGERLKAQGWRESPDGDAAQSERR
jgi:hypothetical protein